MPTLLTAVCSLIYDLGIWGLGDLGTWGLGDLGIWGLGEHNFPSSLAPYLPTSLPP